MRRFTNSLACAALIALPMAVSAGCSGKNSGTLDSGPADSGFVCDSGADCPAGEICKIPDGGSENACLNCGTNGDCRPQQLCSDAGLCLFRPGWGDQCTLNAQCSAGQFCVQGLCVAAKPSDLCQRGNCPQGQVCNVQNQVCEQNLGCTINASCSATQICNPVTLACEPRCDPNNPGLVCNPTQLCVQNRCVDCIQDSNCGDAGLTCNVAAGLCTAPGLCYSDAACPAGEVCNLATNTCGAVPPPCTSNDGCPLQEVCDLVTGACVSPNCLPDEFSQGTGNQTMANAAPIQAPGAFANLTLCGPNDQDWYSLPLLSGDTLQVTIDTNAVGAGYSFDAKMLDTSGVILADSTSLLLTGVAPTTGTYLLQMTDGDPACMYGFRTLVAHGVTCPANPFGNIGDMANAAFIDGGVGPIYLCAGQEDWFEVDVPVGGLDVTLGCDPTHGPLAITAALADGGVLTSSSSGTSTQTILVPNGTPDPAYLEITGDGQQNNAYTLTLAPAVSGGANHNGPPPPSADSDQRRDK
jgi:hypothetical protein